MKTAQQSSESGQILIFLAFALVVLMGIAALAIDGAMLFASRRTAQNAADSAALAGAGDLAHRLANLPGASCSSTPLNQAVSAARAAAITEAAYQGFDLPAELQEGMGVEIICGPQREYLDVHVRLTSESPTAFAHLFFPGPLTTTADSIVRVKATSGAFMDGYAIVALDDRADGALTLSGNVDLEVVGSGILSMSGITANGNVSVNASGPIHYVTTYTPKGYPALSPVPQRLPAPPFHAPIPAPDCSGLPERGEAETGQAQPGWYDRIKVNGNDSLTLLPGLYCIRDGIRMNGNGSLRGDGVTLYVVSGDVSWNGNGEVLLRAPVGEAVPAVGGLLLYLAQGNSGVVTLSGNADAVFRGTIYAPDGTIEVGGNFDGQGQFRSQLVARRVRNHGNPDIRLEYNPAENYREMITILDIWR